MTEPRETTSPTGHGPRRRWFVAGGAAVLVGTVAVYAAGWTGVMGVRTVEVEGATTLDPQQLVSVAGIAQGTPMMRVDLRAATARVADLPQVASVDVHRQWPRTVVVTVSERSAVAMQRSGDGWELIDANGAAFAVAPSKPKDLPTVQRSADEATNTAMLQALAGMTQAVRAKVASITAASPSDIRLTLRRGDAEVKWGSAEESAYKSAVLEVLLQVDAGWYDVSNPDTPTTADAPPQPVTPSASPSPDVSGSPTAAPEAATPSPSTVATSPAAAEAPVGVVPD